MVEDKNEELDKNIEELEKKYQDLQFDYTEFLTSFNVALFELAQKDDSNEWTLNKEKQVSSENALHQKVMSLCKIID